MAVEQSGSQVAIEGGAGRPGAHWAKDRRGGLIDSIWRSVWTARLTPPLAFLAFGLWAAWPLVRHPSVRLPDRSDGTLFTWFFEWVAQSVVHGHNPFVSAALNAPTGVNIMWNTAMFLVAVLCIPFTLGIGAVPTVALLMVVSPIVSASVAYWVLRRLSGSVAGSAIGAALYGFGPFTVGEFSHLQLIFAPFPPLLVLVGYRLVVEQRGSAMRSGILLGLLVGIQVLIAEELVALCAVGSLVAIVWMTVLNWSEARRRALFVLTGTAVGAVLAVVIAAVPLYFQFFGRNSLRQFAVQWMRADVASLVRPGVLNYYASKADYHAALQYPANGSESNAYLGWPLIIAILAVCTWYLVRRERFVAWWLLTALSIAIFMLGNPIDVNGRKVMSGPWGLLSKLPLLGGVIAARFALLILLMIGGLIAWTLARLRGRALVLGILVTAAVLVPLRPVLPLRSAQQPATPRFFTTSAVDIIPQGAITVVLPQVGFPYTAPMLWQIQAHLRFDLVGGYGVFDHNGKSTYFPPLPSFDTALRNVGTTGKANRAALLAQRPSLRESGVRYIVITASEPHMAAVAAASALMTTCVPRAVADVTVCEVPPNL